MFLKRKNAGDNLRVFSTKTQRLWYLSFCLTLHKSARERWWHWFYGTIPPLSLSLHSLCLSLSRFSFSFESGSHHNSSYRHFKSFNQRGGIASVWLRWWYQRRDRERIWIERKSGPIKIQFRLLAAVLSPFCLNHFFRRVRVRIVDMICQVPSDH